ncbi:MAG: hypothetical protein ABEK01_01970 [Candidatus Nanohaloarchaea archaeon]
MSLEDVEDEFLRSHREKGEIETMVEEEADLLLDDHSRQEIRELVKDMEEFRDLVDKVLEHH